MYLEHFGLTEAPFRITPDTGCFFEGAERGATLDALLYVITHDGGIVKVTGEVGSGKTLLCRMLMERLPAGVETIHLANPSLSRDEILLAIADELGIVLATQRASAVLRALQEHLIERHAQGRQVVALIDEAHAMPLETLEEIRLLSNLEANRHRLLQIVLFGQPELNATLARREMRQLKERITHNFSLEPLERPDVAAYIARRLHAAGYRGPDPLTPAALKLITRASLGLTRRVNILCDKALLAAFADNTRQVAAAHVRAAARDAEFRGTTLPRLGTWLAAAAAANLLAGAVLAYLWWPPEPGAASRPLPAAPVTVAPPRPASTAAPAPAPAPLPAPTSLSIPQTATAPDTDAGLGPLTRQHLQETRRWLAGAGDERWFIQLLSSDAAHADHVEAFVARAAQLAEAAPLRVYAVELNGARRVGVIYGDFPTREVAAQALGRLPEELKAAGPYLRQVRRLRR